MSAMDDKLVETAFEQLGLRAEEHGGDSFTDQAPSKLKSRIYTAMARAQQESGPLATVTETKRAGRKLCVFEDLVQIAPVGSAVKSQFYCHTCHARVLAERMEHPPIWWPHCPYAEFKNS